MKYSIQILEEEIKEIQKPNLEEEDEGDIVDAVLMARKLADLRLSIKYLKQMDNNLMEFNEIKDFF